MREVTAPAADIEHIRSLLPELALINDRSIADAVATVWAYLWRQSSYDRVEDAPVSPQLRRRSLIDQVRCVAMIALDTVVAYASITVSKPTKTM